MCAILLFFLAAGSLTAQEVRSLTLEEVCRLAEQNSISLQKRAIDLEFDRIRAKSLWAQIFPSISVRGGAEYGFPLVANTPRPDPSYTATLGLSLGFSAALPFTMANISLAYKNSLLNYEEARRVLINETSKTFYSLLAQKNNLQVLEGTMRLAMDQMERDRIARQSGYVGELDFLSAQVSSERAKLAYNRALTDYQNALGKFLVALGLVPQETLVLEGNPGITALFLDPEALINERLARRPDLIAQRNEIERLKNARTESFLSAKSPSIDLSASWGASLNNGFADTVIARAAVTIPFDSWMPRTKADQTVKRSGAEYQKARLELQNMENNARQEIRSYADSISNTWTELEIARLQASYAQRAYELAERSYRTGTMNFLDFETVRNRLTEARQQQLQSELNYKILVLDLASSLNMEEGELQNYSKQK
ncbi:MAG: TolC family protein [Treponema sp.]|nr:TolC family protein [Treponema sp.]